MLHRRGGDCASFMAGEFVFLNLVQLGPPCLPCLPCPALTAQLLLPSLFSCLSRFTPHLPEPTNLLQTQGGHTVQFPTLLLTPPIGKKAPRGTNLTRGGMGCEKQEREKGVEDMLVASRLDQQ